MRLAAYLIMTLLFSTATAQNPTILQGSYVSNVFGQSNFVKNPNAQTGVTGVTLTTATATRSTTTPLVATTEWNVTITSANGTAAWATRTFDAGMKNQNCEARFTYRGFQATSKAQIKQGANVVAELVLTPSATDPRIASINFPCGDLSSATTFVITDTATLSGTHEIGGIYVGLATNQANIAQAETVVRARQTAAQTVPNVTRTTILYQTEDLDVYGEYDPSTGIYTAKKSGEYLITASVMSGNVAWSIGEYFEVAVMKNSASNSYCRNYKEMEGNNTANEELLISCIINLQAGENTRITWTHQQGGNISTVGDGSYVFLQIARFPSSSELVVTPETQNVWAGASWYNSGYFNLHDGTVPPTAYVTYNGANLGSPTYKTSFGKCSPPTTSSNDFGCSVENMPVGKYKVTLTALNYVIAPSNTLAICTYRMRETTTNSTVGNRNEQTVVNSSGQRDYSSATMTGIFNNTSVGTRNFVLQASKRNGATSGAACYLGQGVGGNDIHHVLTIEPLDNNANSALYVQGPVKAAGTGTAIPSGYVGEVVSAYLPPWQNLPNSQHYDVNSIVLPSDGIYSISAVWVFKHNGASVTAGDHTVGILQTAGNTSSGRKDGLTYFVDVGRTGSNEYITMTMPPLTVRLSGNTLTYPDNTTATLTNRTLYQKAYVGNVTAGAVQITGSIQAIRIN